jgi:prevent-host-death family protein
MNIWQVHDAKARFSELLNACLTEGPQIVTRRGTETAVLVPFDEWRRLSDAKKPSLKSLLLADYARADLLIPHRRAVKRRSPISLVDI